MATVQLQLQDDFAVLRLENPGRLNAFTRAMRAEIGRLLGQAAANPSIRGAVITGTGEAFCAGQDFNEVADWTEDTPWVSEFEEFARAILSFPKPLVAAVNGVAAGGGFQMALMCDMRIGHRDVRMGQTEVRRGLASVTGTWLLQNSVGRIRARELALSGRLMEADELLHISLLDALVPQESVLDSALDAGRRLAESPSDSFSRTKAWLYEQISGELAAIFSDAERFHRMGFANGASQEGARRFLGRS
jgi:enoyl-CoA hydratase